MKSREFILSTGTKIFLGKNAENNDSLVNDFKGKENIILHTAKPGSPFCIIEKLNPNQHDLKEASIICASKSQDWRDNKQDIDMHIFTGKSVNKEKGMKPGLWVLKKRPKVIKVKKKDIEEWIIKNKI